MKKNALAIILALCMVISMLPATVFAAPAMKSGSVEVMPQLAADMEAPAELTALPELPAETDAGKYKISAKVVKGSSHGEIELSATTANAQEVVYLLANPDDGYVVELGGSYEYYYYQMEVVYVGLDIYQITMPDGDVSLEIKFVAAEGSNHTVNLSVNDSKGGTITASRSKAKENESVILTVVAKDGYYLEGVSAVDANGDDVAGGYLGQQETGEHIFEVIMPATAVYIEAIFKVIEPHYITIDLGNPPCGTAKVDRDYLYPGEEFTLTVEPALGYEVNVVDPRCNGEYVPITWAGKNTWKGVMPNGPLHISISMSPVYYHVSAYVVGNVGGGAYVPSASVMPGRTAQVRFRPDEGYKVATITGIDEITYDGNDMYSFIMPEHDVSLAVTYKLRNNPVTVTAGAHGTAAADAAEAEEGEIVTIICTPDEGYKVASVTGVAGLTDNGDNTWSFTMPDNAVEVTVTFKKLYEAVTVTVDTGIGGTAVANVAEAKLGDTVTVICTPEEGYRIAQVTGIDGLTDNGNGTYSFTMPDEAVELHVLFLRNENPFLDVNETHFFHDPVLWAVGEGITNGIDATHFGPYMTTNRAAVVTMLWRYAGSPEPTTTENPFTDVPADSWYTKSVLWAVEQGITKGLTATTFGPNENCNRAQVVTFLYRALKAAAPEGAENPFEDVEAGSWYEDPVLWALANGVTTGADATHFNPNGECLRAQFVTFLYRTSLIPPTEYALSYAAEPAEGGEVVLSHETAVAGETVTVTVTPAEGYVIASVVCESGAEVTQVSETEYTFVMPAQAENVLVTFEEIPVEPTDPTEPTDPEEPDPTDPVVTYTLDVRTNINAEITYVDGKTAAAPGESIFFYVVPEAGYVLTGVGLFDPNNEIDVSKIQLYAHDDNLYEFVMIDHDIILNFNFDPA